MGTASKTSPVRGARKIRQLSSVGRRNHANYLLAGNRPPSARTEASKVAVCCVRNASSDSGRLRVSERGPPPCRAGPSVLRKRLVRLYS